MCFSNKYKLTFLSKIISLFLYICNYSTIMATITNIWDFFHILSYIFIRGVIPFTSLTSFCKQQSQNIHYPFCSYCVQIHIGMLCFTTSTHYKISNKNLQTIQTIFLSHRHKYVQGNSICNCFNFSCRYKRSN